MCNGFPGCQLFFEPFRARTSTETSSEDAREKSGKCAGEMTAAIRFSCCFRQMMKRSGFFFSGSCAGSAHDESWDPYGSIGIAFYVSCDEYRLSGSMMPA